MKKLSKWFAAVGCTLLLVFVLVNTVRARRNAENARFISEAGLVEVSLNVGNLDRRALVHVPRDHDQNTPLPIVVMIHGAGGTPEAAARETGWVAKSDTEGFLVVFPEATRPDAKQPPKFGRNNPTWNDGSGRFHSGEQDIPDVMFISMLLDQLESEYSIDQDRVFITGFSNGASMTFRLGIELSERIAAIAPVAGALWIKEAQVSRPVSMLYVTGNKDPLNPMEGGKPKMAVGANFKDAPDQLKPPVKESVNAWTAMLECKPEPKSLVNQPDGIVTMVYVGGRDGAEVHFTTIDEQGHAWPGGKNLLPELIVGKATNRLNATDAIWEFFKNHPRKLPQY